MFGHKEFIPFNCNYYNDSNITALSIFFGFSQIFLDFNQPSPPRICSERNLLTGDFFSLPTDQNIRLYDTTHGQFKEFRNIVARDVGWSIIDTDFRFEMKWFFPFIHLHKNRIKFKITCNSISLIYPALSWFLLFSKDLRV